MSVLIFETDYDYSILFNGKEYVGHLFAIKLDSHEDLSKIVIAGPWGSLRDENTKCFEAEDALEQIKANPTELFDNRGGNRGVTWVP